MKVIFLLIVVVFESFYFCTAKAANPDRCYWVNSGNDDHQITTVRVPDSVNLKMVGVGSTMGYVSRYLVETATQPLYSGVKCPYPDVTKLIITYTIMPSSGMKLVPGHHNVYQTGVQGIGVRINTAALGGVVRYMPITHTTQNKAIEVTPILTPFNYEFIRVDTVVGTGRMNLNFQVAFKVNDWHALTINSQSRSTEVVMESFFTGCSGVKKEIKVPMGDVLAGEIMLDKARVETFNMDVRCVGLPAGSKLPIKAYFEGDSPGTGRLNLLSGGAKGVEISLLGGTGTSTALPFSKSKAISMTWFRTDAQGELYNLSIKARYVKKPGVKIEPGKADAVLNYIIEYD